MSRWVLALVAVGFALAPVRAADPKPLWEIDTATEAKWRSSVVWVGYAPDGKTLVAQVEDRKLGDGFQGSKKERLIVWDVPTQKEKFNLPLGECDLFIWNDRANAFTKTGTLLVASYNAREVRLANKEIVTSPSLVKNVVAVWVNPDSSDSVWLTRPEPSGYALAVGKMPSFAADPKKPNPKEKWHLSSLKSQAENSYSAFAVSPDTTRFAVAVRDNSGAQAHTLTLYTIAIDEKLKLNEVATVPSTHKGYISKIQFSPDGKTLATGSGDSTVCLWDVEKAGKGWKPWAIIPAGRGTVGSLSYSPDGRTLAVGTWDKQGQANLFLIDLTAGKVAASHRLGGQLMTVAYSPDGKTLVTGDYSGRIKAWNAEALRNP